MNRILFVILFALSIQVVRGQDTLYLTLDHILEMSREQSIAARVARTNFSNRYWQYRSFRANYRPQLTLNGVLPDLNRSISQITLDNGQDVFIRRSLSTSSVELSLSQNIGLTGSEIFVSSGLSRIDVFTDPSYVSYLANPAVLGIRQPLFAFNPFKWDLRTEPLRYEEAKRQLNEDMESVSLQGVELYFEVLQARTNRTIQELNVGNNDTLYQISVGRYDLGKIAENDLLQMELNVMNARNDLAQAEMDLEFSTMRLLNYLRLPVGQPIVIAAPAIIPEVIVDEQFALQQARENRADVIELERLVLEAERNLQQARAESRFQADVFATYGLTQSGTDLSGAYINPQDQQRVRLGVQVPILTWGRNKARIKTAEANMDLASANAEQALEQFEQEVLLLVRQLNRYRDKLVIAAKADTIAQRRFDITMKRYLIGKVGILDLNLAIQEKDQAKAAFISSMRMFWNAFFDLRRKTLYDFILNKPVSYSILEN